MRGTVESIVSDDAEASFYRSLQRRYGQIFEITDRDVRVVVTIRPTAFVAVSAGLEVNPRT